jgi:hypothetical protein
MALEFIDTTIRHPFSKEANSLDDFIDSIAKKSRAEKGYTIPVAAEIMPKSPDPEVIIKDICDLREVINSGSIYFSAKYSTKTGLGMTLILREKYENDITKEEYEKSIKSRLSEVCSSPDKIDFGIYVYAKALLTADKRMDAIEEELKERFPNAKLSREFYGLCGKVDELALQRLHEAEERFSIKPLNLVLPRGQLGDYSQPGLQ